MTAESAAAALTGGYHLAYLIGAALAVVAIIAAVTILRSEETGDRDGRGHEGARRRARHRARLRHGLGSRNAPPSWRGVL